VVRSFIIALLLAQGILASDSYDYFEIIAASSANAPRSTEWQPGEGIPLEVGGLDWTSDGRLAVAIRKGEVWLIENADSESKELIKYKRFASGLHEPLGLLADGDDLLVAQRTELTRLVDRNSDGIADEYLTEAAGWNVSGAYHGYTYGPVRDGNGTLWLTTNIDMGEGSDNDAAWRGWAVTVNPDGTVDGQAAGMRSPSGLGVNRQGDVFYSDQQGTWMPATPIHHLRPGAFYGNPSGLASQDLPNAAVAIFEPIPESILYPEALKALPELVPPAVWLPYNKVGRSATDILAIDQAGAFGPFDGQLLVGEFTNAEVNRVFLEKIDGQYQGACFRFLDRFPSAVFRMAFGPDNRLYVGMTNRGWSSLGTASYGLVRVGWNGNTPFEILEMRAKPDGFELVFTRPLDPKLAQNPSSYRMSSYTYLYSSAYGGDELDSIEHTIEEAILSEDRLSVRLRINGLRPYYVHELDVSALRDSSGHSLDHPQAYYTLNRIPKTESP